MAASRNCLTIGRASSGKFNIVQKLLSLPLSGGKLLVGGIRALALGMLAWDVIVPPVSRVVRRVVSRVVGDASIDDVFDLAHCERPD